MPRISSRGGSLLHLVPVQLIRPVSRPLQPVGRFESRYLPTGRRPLEAFTTPHLARRCFASFRSAAEHTKEQATGRQRLSGPSADAFASINQDGTPTDQHVPQFEHEGASEQRSMPPEAATADQEIREQIYHLRVVRELEERLGKARHDLHLSFRKAKMKREAVRSNAQQRQFDRGAEWVDDGSVTETRHVPQRVELKREDFLDLVDLYFYSHKSRFLSESPDASPTPLQLEDYSFRISEDFSPATNSAETTSDRDHDGPHGSAGRHVETEMQLQKLDEIKALQRFVDLLLDDYSSLRDLFRAYQDLPRPGVSYLSRGVIRLFLQRMSTPWRKSETAMLRYLSLLDDMQQAQLPITAWEWSSAIHLAGHSFANVSNTDVAAAFRVWREMEDQSGVAARDVTFNILFDIVVKAGKFVLAEEILREMHDRGFRLNRLGRVSLIYYYGRKKDGDGVRKAYRDFVEAGEIVDTLVLNCVMVSLIHADEPAAAEQIYERMKGMQQRFATDEALPPGASPFPRYPPPASDRLGREAASNSLGRILLRASRLKTVLPRHHAELQKAMPLTPNAVTYRTLLTHHARTSGNLDRLTVLIDEMWRMFGIPVSALTFQTLFMGFARHGGSSRVAAPWTRQRLQITFTACVVCLQAGRYRSRHQRAPGVGLTLPSVPDAERDGARDEERRPQEAWRRPDLPRPTAWKTFIRQFASPYPAQARSDVYPASGRWPGSPSGADTTWTGDYQLPVVGLTSAGNSPEDMGGLSAFHPTQDLAVWILRAFARCTSDRKVVEDVWYQLKRDWRPAGGDDLAVAVRELRRALVYCDTHHGGR